MIKYLAILTLIVFYMCSSVFSQIALFQQTMIPDDEANNYLEILLTNEFWTSLSWVFVIPALRISFKIFNPVQVFLASYLIAFVTQIISNTYWLKIETPVDDYITMIFIILALYISKVRTFG